MLKDCPDDAEFIIVNDEFENMDIEVDFSENKNERKMCILKIKH